MATSLRCFILLVFMSRPAWSNEVKSKEQFVWLNSRETFTLRCSPTYKDYDGLYLLFGLQEKEVFFLYEETNKLTVSEEYQDRLQTEGELKNLKIKLANMTEDDSGVYWCKYRKGTNRFIGDGSTMVVVNGRPCPTPLTSNLVMVSAISAGSVFLLCIIVLLLWLVPRMKKSMKKRRVHARRSDSVYEDMRKSSNTPHRGHHPTQPTNHFP